MAFLEDLQTTTTTDTVSEDNEVGTFQSIMAGIGSTGQACWHAPQPIQKSFFTSGT